MTSRVSGTSLLLGAMLALGVSACGGGGETSEGAAATSGGEPTIVITDQAEWDGLVSSGQATYDKACGGCHPGGEADLGPKVTGLAWSVDAMTKQIRDGSGRMKPIGENRLPEADMRGLMVYMSTIGGIGDVQGP